TTPPSISCPGDADLGCNPEVPDAMPGDVTASDNCGAITVVAVQGTATQQGCFFTRIDRYTATDACGNQSSCARTLQWKEDLQRPVLSGVPEDIGIACEGELPPVPAVTATDNCDGPVPVSFREVPGGTNCGGIFYERIWTAIDGCGNATSYRQTIRLIDEAPPVIVVPADTTINFGESIPTPVALITDNCSRMDQDFSEVRTDHNPGAFTLVRTWTATDGCFNSASASQTIQVRDTTPPDIVIINPMLENIPNGGSMDLFSCEDPAVAMADIQVADLNPAVEVETFDKLLASNSCDALGYYRKWKCGYTATDGAGNVAEYSFYVYQYDTMAPELLGVPPSVDLLCDGGSHLPIAEVFADDACNGSVPVAFNEVQLLNPADANQQGLIRTWTTEDACGNVAEASQMITFCGFDMSLAASTIGNTVWFDANANGLQESSEVGIDSLQVNLYWIDSSQNAQMVYSTMSRTEGGREGQFSFDYLFPGSYQIEIAFPEYLAPTMMWQGDDPAMDSDINPGTLMSDLIEVDTSEILMHIDAGVILKEELPLVLSRLSGHSSQCINTISWSIDHESQVNKYEIQRASDGGPFTTIGSVDPQLDFSRTLEYVYKDVQAQGLNQYRVKVLLDKGEVSYSETLDLELNCRRKIAPGVGIFPNPFVNIVSIGFNLNRGGEASVKVVDNLGRVVEQVTKKLPRGKHVQELNLRNEPSGIYWIQVRIDDELVTRKIVKGD
ncbi:MAG: T9SS type A sorting domain-containing protein, partial [Saprospiraceae bacterium]|nr:T9SS type A sorting domain-containing protein [Saprospiraceae bacterium]